MILESSLDLAGNNLLEPAQETPHEDISQRSESQILIDFVIAECDHEQGGRALSIGQMSPRRRRDLRRAHGSSLSLALF